MSVIELLRARDKDLGGGFLVRRLLPAFPRQSVGPFIFFDHFGPVTSHPGDNHDVRPHPHIGLATVTYLFEGAMMHRDTVGSVQRIEPGAINWMTAGRGIVHSERAPPDLRHAAHVSHGLQLWAALPKAFEETAPGFSHTPAEAIPAAAQGGNHIRVLIGSAFGVTSPVATFAPTLYLDIAMGQDAPLVLSPPGATFERAIYSVDHPLVVDGADVPAFTLAVLTPGTAANIRAPAGARCAVIGGEPLDGPRFLWWNFVSSSKERIERAKSDWAAQRMGQIPGEHEFIPLPEK
ncbi:MAG TPA: pirin family protein [Casimicrobiaceae bacterium]|nr:pirin family protein [Casimicrobiaceae bacterium]